MRRALTCLPLLLACASAEEAPPDAGAWDIPLGTFCYLVNGAETCLGAGGVTATTSLTSGNVWFQVAGSIEVTVRDPWDNETTETREVIVSGQLPEGAELPRDADNVVVGLPVSGTCESTQPTSPFGGCTRFEREAHCDSVALYGEGGTRVTVLALDGASIAAFFDGEVGFDLPHDCCRNDASFCASADPPAFTPGGPYVMMGRLHTAL